MKSLYKLSTGETSILSIGYLKSQVQKKLPAALCQQRRLARDQSAVGCGCSLRPASVVASFRPDHKP
jgi:hypothetical protein